MLKNAKLIGDNIDTSAYLTQPTGVKRGDKAFVMSRGELMRFYRCPSKWLKGVGDESSDSKDYGSLIDMMVLTPNKFNTRYVVAPAMYPCEPTKKDPRTEKPWTLKATYCADWKDQQETKGLEVVTASDKADVDGAAQSLAEYALDFIGASKVQVMCMAEWHDETGIVVPVKVLLDLVPDKDSRFGTKLGDFKSCQSARPKDFEKSIFDYNYDAQAWLNRELYVMATNERREDWQFVIQENTAPWECPPEQPILSLESFSDGEIKIKRALRKYCQCLKTGIWPSYDIGNRMRVEGGYVAKQREYDSLALMEDAPEFTAPKKPKAKSSDDVIP